QGDEGTTVGRVPAAQALGEPGQVGDALGVHRQNLDIGGGGAGARQHAVVLDGADDQPARAGGDGALDSQGVGLGAAAGEHEGLGRSADQGGDIGPRLLDHGAGGAAGGVHR